MSQGFASVHGVQECDLLPAAAKPGLWKRLGLSGLSLGACAVGAGFTVIVVCAFAMRVYGLGREGYWGDEYYQVSLYSLPLHYTCWFALKLHSFGPADFAIGWLAYRIDPSEWMCRLPSVVWGVVSVATCFFLARRLFSWREGLLASALLCLCRMHLVVSQDARPYSICLASMLVMLLLFMRAFDKPSMGRVVFFAIVAYGTTLTRSLTPLVFLLVLGVSLSVAYGKLLLSHRRSSESGEHSTRFLAVRRLWWATTIAGLAAVPVLILLISMNPHTAFAGSEPNVYGIDTRIPMKWVSYTGIAAAVLADQFGLVVLGLAASGVILIVRRWDALPWVKRCVVFVLMGVGPTYLLIFATFADVKGFFDRYNFYLLPVVSIFAAFALVQLMAMIKPKLQRMRLLRGAVMAVCIVATLSYPAAMSGSEMSSYRRRDWRGCARYLSQQIKPKDAVLVLTEQPFGRVQKRFWGKYEWPVDHRPLGEAIWTLAYSDPHFERLRRVEGRCFAVIAYPTGPQSKEAYREHGLQKPPDGYKLAKFRGLDLLIPIESRATALEQALAICTDLATLEHANPSTKVIPMALKARILGELGDDAGSLSAYAEAKSLVPAIQRAYFDGVTSTWAPIAGRP